MKRIRDLLSSVYGEISPTSPVTWQPKPLSEKLAHNGRHLYLDSLGICALVNLYHATEDLAYLMVAESLTRAVINELGRRRAEPMKHLGEATDEQPLLGGLRSGEVEEERDGQRLRDILYFALALNRLDSAEPKKATIFNQLAVQLLKTTHPKFVYRRETPDPKFYKRLDESLKDKPERTEGTLEPFLGLAVTRLVQKQASDELVMRDEINDYENMVKNVHYRDWSSNNLLELGQVLWIAHWSPYEEWAQSISQTCIDTLASMWSQGYFEGHRNPAAYEASAALGLTLNGAADAQWKARAQDILSYWAGQKLEAPLDIFFFCLASEPQSFFRMFKAPASAIREELMSLSVREIKTLLQAKGISYVGLREKQELVDAMLKQQ